MGRSDRRLSAGASVVAYRVRVSGLARHSLVYGATGTDDAASGLGYCRGGHHGTYCRILPADRQEVGS